MKMIERTNTTELRKFYLLLAAAIVVMFFGVLPWLFGAARSPMVLYVAGAIAIAGSALPAMMYPIYQLWMQIARVLGWINSRLLLGFAFYVMVLPIGIIARRLGKLGYKERPAKSPDSYRVTRERPLTRDDLENPF